MQNSSEDLPFSREWLTRRLKQNERSPLDLAFGWQAEAIACHDKQVALDCGGRAGKSRGALLKWCEVKARKPGFLTPYIGLTRESAKRIIWPQTFAVNEELGLGLKPHFADLTFTDAQGSVLSIIGANREDEIHKLRGFPMVLAILDEGAFFRDELLRQLIYDVIGPRLADADGELWVMSSPGLVPAGLFYRITTGEQPGLKVFRGAYMDNPHLPLDLPGQPPRTLEEKRAEREKYLRDLRARNGWDHCQKCGRHEDGHEATEECADFQHHPTYQREWLGLWVRDDEELVYAFRRGRHLIEAMPADYEVRKHEWIHVIGIDYGYTGATAWVVLVFRGYGSDPTVYVVESDEQTGLTPGQVGERTQALANRYEAAILVGDPAAKGYISESNVRFALGVEDAEKTEKRAYQELMNGDFRSTSPDGTPRIQVVRSSNQGLCEDWEKLPWKDYPKDDPRWHTEEDPRFPNHRPDAALYGWRRCMAYLNAPDNRPKRPDRDSAEYGWDDEDVPKESKPWWDPY